MKAWTVKIVPKDEPNADGRWVVVHDDEAPALGAEIVPGHYVVAQFRWELQDGGPMHAMFLTE